MKKVETYARPQARNPRLQKSMKSETRTLTARSILRGPRRVQVHVHDGRDVDGDGCDECENHVRAERESSESHRCEVTPIQKMARKATEEQKAAELKNKVQTVKESLEEQPHTADDVLKDVVQKQQEEQQTVQQYQAAEEARVIAAKEVVEAKCTEAAVETSREGGCCQSSTTNKARTVSFRNDGCRQHAE